ncbi:GGDEF domain-containing protein [Microbulbifer yueqingensis]|uniref:diguanylate cyclase n=1 Tax=Microbulbifer yueqingensis TaxID=658219 RepID=A0A1G9BBM5_9GAMM|nr:GGDEF domain-containing protein [Microbulbifer yueqingensis]SDK36956.1 diguanylate cyclase (GGDEF) domain-containing protein [Microbulbifer yueqingensis]
MGSGHQFSSAQNPSIRAAELDLRRRVQASGYMLIFSLAITAAMAVLALTDGAIWQALTLSGVTVLILVTYIGINLLGPSSKTPAAVTCLLLILYFYLLLSGGVNNTGLMWAVMLVPGFINLFGYRNGTLILMAVGAATALALFYPDFPGLKAEYDLAYRARFVAVFGALTALTALLDSSRDEAQKLLNTLTVELENHASTDALTGLANRREAYRALQELERAGLGYTVLVGDLDHFKSLNDTRGHNFGDRVLKDVGKVLRRNTRSGDLVARWGGEEFLVLLPNTDAAGGAVLAEKLRERVERLGQNYDPPARLSISFGVAGAGDDDRTQSELLAEADARMYRAKHSGRNRVVTA